MLDTSMRLKYDDMISILDHVHQNVPTVCSAVNKELPETNDCVLKWSICIASHLEETN